jgi:hypothetical protein
MAASGHPRARGAALFVVLGIAVLQILTTAPASAHGGSGNYVTAITSVQPPVLGLRVSTASDGSSLTITNGTGRTVIVMGVDDEAYLKFTSQGVWKNVRSPTAYLNEGGSRSDVPGSADPRAEPEWAGVSDSTTFQFHDHRTDWMGNSRPEVVSQAPNKRHLINRWSIDLVVDGTPVTVEGTLRWVPSGFTLLDVVFVVFCVVATLAVAVVIVLESRRRPDAPVGV